MLTHLSEFIAVYPTKKFEKGETVIYQGEQPTCLYAVKSGFVKAYDINGDGSEQLVWFGSTSDIFPIVFFDKMSIVPAAFFYSAFSDIEVYCINETELVDYLEKNPKSLLTMYRQTAQSYSDLMKRLGAVEKPKASDKIIYTLDFLASRFNGKVSSGAVEITVRLTHQDIANLVGLTRETTAMELKKLKDGGYIDYDKWHFSVNRRKLQQLL